jgi:DNA-directed RNA polymerase subunit RPC12/RpoP
MKCANCGKECLGIKGALKILTVRPWKAKRFIVCSENCGWDVLYKREDLWLS